MSNTTTEDYLNTKKANSILLKHKRIQNRVLKRKEHRNEISGALSEMKDFLCEEKVFQAETKYLQTEIATKAIGFMRHQKEKIVNLQNKNTDLIQLLSSLVEIVKNQSLSLPLQSFRPNYSSITQMSSQRNLSMNHVPLFQELKPDTSSMDSVPTSSLQASSEPLIDTTHFSIQSDPTHFSTRPNPIPFSTPPNPIPFSTPPKPLLFSTPPNPIPFSTPPNPLLFSTPPNPLLFTTPPNPLPFSTHSNPLPHFPVTDTVKIIDSLYAHFSNQSDPTHFSTPPNPIPFSTQSNPLLFSTHSNPIPFSTQSNPSSFSTPPNPIPFSTPSNPLPQFPVTDTAKITDSYIAKKNYYNKNANGVQVVNGCNEGHNEVLPKFDDKSQNGFMNLMFL